MSISSIASSSVYQSNYTNPFQAVKKDFKDINSALQSGDLSAAQTAFSAFQTDTSKVSGNNSSNSMSQDIQGLGSALQSGSLTDAQQAFSKIQSDMKGHGKFAKQQMELQSSLSSGSDTGNTIKQDFSNLSTALSSGNLTDAQKAFATLQQDAPAQNSQNSQFSKDIQSLGNALQSGDLSSAQEVFSTIQAKMSQGLQNQSAVSATSTTANTNPVQQDFQNLSTALQSGNMSDAQKAFATLQQDMTTSKTAASGSAGAGHHHHHHSGSSQSVGSSNSTDLLNALTTNSSNTASTSNTANSTTSLSSLLESAISNYMQSSSNSNLQNGLSSSTLFSTPTFA